MKLSNKSCKDRQGRALADRPLLERRSIPYSSVNGANGDRPYSPQARASTWSETPNQFPDLGQYADHTDVSQRIVPDA